MTMDFSPPSVVVSMVSAIQHVDRLSERRLRALHDPFGQGRMRVHGQRDVRHGRSHLNRESELADQVARVRADDRRAEQDLGVHVREELHEALVLSRRQGAADRGEGDATDADLAALRGGLGFLHPHGGNLGIREDRRGHRPVVDLDRVARDHLRGDESLLGRLVREEWRADHVADGEHVRVRRPELGIDLDVPLGRKLDARFVRMKLVRVWATADGDQDHVRAPGDEPFRGHDVHDRLAFLLPPSACLGLRVDFDPEFLQSAADDSHRFRVGPRQELVQNLDHDDAATELRVERPDFQTGDAAANDCEIRRDPREFQGLLRAHDLLAVESKSREIARAPARRDDRVPEPDVLGEIWSSEMEARGAGERRLAVHDLDAVALAQRANSVHEALDDGGLPLLEPGHVDLDRSRLDAAFRRVLDRLDEVRGVDERLARDASVIEAFTAELVALDEEDALAELRRADSRRAPLRPRRRRLGGPRSDPTAPQTYPFSSRFPFGRLEKLLIGEDSLLSCLSAGDTRSTAESAPGLSQRLGRRVLVQGSVLAAAVVLFAVTSSTLPSVIHPMCIEGGTYSGFPVSYWLQCFGPPEPGGSRPLDSPQGDPAAIAIDIAFWYALVWFLGYFVRRIRATEGPL